MLHDVARALHAEVRPGRDEFVALCPVHDDHSPSLSVKAGTKGIVMTCRACGATVDDVLSTGLAWSDGTPIRVSDLFYDPHTTTIPFPRRPSRSQPSAPSEVVVGRLPTGELSLVHRERLAQDAKLLERLWHERAISSTIATDLGLGVDPQGRILIPTADRSGGLAPRTWLAFAEQRTSGTPKIRGPKGAKPDLFPTPESHHTRPDEPLLLVEGEADALVAFSLGMQAIATPGTQGWLDSDAARFRRFSRVIIIGDADEPGRAWAAQAHQDLQRVGVTSELRDYGQRPKGYDLTDLALSLIDSGETLASVIETLPRVVAGSVTTDLFQPPLPAETPVISNGLFYPSATHVVYGKGGAGKTYLALTAARDEIRRGGRVLFVDYETGGRTIRTRLDAVGFTRDDLKTFTHLDVKSGNARPLTGEEILELLEAFNPTLIIVDSWSSVHGAANLGDVKDDAAVEAALARVFRPLAQHGAAVVILDHTPKGDKAAKGHPYGSQRKLTGTLVTLEVRQVGQGRVAVKCWKDNVGDRPTGGTTVAMYEYSDGTARVRIADVDSPEIAWPTIIMQRVSRALEAALPDGLSASEIQTEVSGKAPVIVQARDILVDEGYAITRLIDGRTVYESVKPYREGAS